MSMARSYYAQALKLNNKNVRALYGFFPTDQPKEMTEETRVLEGIEKVLESLTEKTTS